MNSTGSVDSLNSDYKPPDHQFATAPNTGGRLNIAAVARSQDDGSMLPAMNGSNIKIDNNNTL